MSLKYAFRDASGARKNVTLEETASTSNDLKEKIAAASRIPVKWQTLLVGRPPKEVDCSDEKALLKTLIPTGTMITVRDDRPKDDDKPNLAPSTLKKSKGLPMAKPTKQAEKWTEEKRALADEFKKGEICVIVGIKDPALNGKDCKIIQFHPDIKRWEVKKTDKEDDDGTIFLSPDQLQSKFEKKKTDGPGITTCAKGIYCNVTKDSNIVVNNNSDLQKEWRRGGFASQRPPVKCPIIDFNDNTVVFCYMGNRRSGGYEIKAASCVDKGKETWVYYNMKIPQMHQSVVMKESQAFHVVAITKTRKTVKFVMKNA